MPCPFFLLCSTLIPPGAARCLRMTFRSPQSAAGANERYCLVILGSAMTSNRRGNMLGILMSRHAYHRHSPHQVPLLFTSDRGRSQASVLVIENRLASDTAHHVLETHKHLAVLHKICCARASCMVAAIVSGPPRTQYAGGWKDRSD